MLASSGTTLAVWVYPLKKRSNWPIALRNGSAPFAAKPYKRLINHFYRGMSKNSKRLIRAAAGNSLIRGKRSELTKQEGQIRVKFEGLSELVIVRLG